MSVKPRWKELLEDATKRAQDPNHVTPYHLTVGALGKLGDSKIRGREATHIIFDELSEPTEVVEPIKHPEWGTW